MIGSPINLDLYFQRIGYQGAREPTLELLKQLHDLHAHSIPFENLNPLLGLPVPLDKQALQLKLVEQKRGGYCFEQNLLLSGVLQALGFKVTTLAARVRWGVPEEIPTPRSHMLMLVECEGDSWLADVGFGGMTLTTPLRVHTGLEQPTPHETFRLTRASAATARGSTAQDVFVLEVKIPPAQSEAQEPQGIQEDRDAWRPVYRFDPQPQILRDYEVFNWYVSTHPHSFFSYDLIAALPIAGGRYTLRNNELSKHTLGGESHKQLLRSGAEIQEALADLFKIRLPDHPALESRLQQLVPAPKTA